jgi:putative inorganic carbon (HCO3(-)) transporter
LSILLSVFIWKFVLNENKDLEIKKNLSFLLNKKNLVFYLLITFLALNLLSTIFSLEPIFSFWGSPTRSGGLLNLIFYATFGLLAFLTLKKEDWPKIWNTAIITGILVSLIAIGQWQGMFENILITYETRPPSTLGNPIMLAVYLLLLSLPTLSFALKEEKITKKIFYSLAFLLFVFTIFLTYSRAAYLGLAAGLLYFILSYPYKKRLLSFILKTSLVLSLLLAGWGVYYVNANPKLPGFIQQNKTLTNIIGRLSIEKALQDTRIDSWQISWQALKDRPILGYGPENFSIGFDEYYDPQLPNLGKLTRESAYWDKAHNFIFDISVTTGLPALIVFLAFLTTLFWRLQKIKTERIAARGLQATLIGYLTANLFSIDTFSIYLIFFLMVGYAFHLISSEQEETNEKLGSKKYKKTTLYETVLILLLISFIWFTNIKPLQINTRINIADILAEKKSCQEAILVIESILPQKSFLESYAKLKYAEIINNCLAQKTLEKTKPLIEKTIKALEETVEIRPYYTRAYFLLGKYNNLLMADWGESRTEQAILALERAKELSPRRSEITAELITAYNLSINFYLKENDYQKLADSYQRLIELDPTEPQYYASLAFVYQKLGLTEEAKKQALKIIELFPEYKIEAETFLKSL